MIINSNKGLLAFDYWATAECGGVLKKPFRIVQYAIPVAELQDAVYGRTAVVARHTRAKDGSSQFDKATLSVDERETFDRLCRQAADEAARVMMPFLPFLGVSYLYDKGFVTSGAVKAGEYAKVNGELYMALVDSDVANIATSDFEKLDADVSHTVHFITKKAVDVYENSLTMTENSLREMLETYIMARWFQDVLPERYEQYQAEYDKARDNLRYNLNMMDRPVRGGHPF